MNSAAQQAGIIAIEDIDFQALSVAHNDRWIAEMTDFLRQLGLEVVSSMTNFLLIGFDNMAHLTADEAAKRLAQDGILLRTMAPYGLANYLRMSMGTDAEMEKGKPAYPTVPEQSVIHGKQNNAKMTQPYNHIAIIGIGLIALWRWPKRILPILISACMIMPMMSGQKQDSLGLAQRSATRFRQL